MTDLGTLGGSSTTAIAMNDRGQIVGTSATGNTRFPHPFLWDRGTMVDINGADSTWISTPLWIDSEGEVAGRMDSWVIEQTRTFFWEHGRWTDLGRLDPSSDETWPQAVSSTGVIGGSELIHRSPWQSAWVWTRGTMTAIPELEGILAINQAGVVLGVPTFVSGYSGTVLWFNGTIVSLDPEGGYGSASGINAAGQIIGTTGPYDLSRAVLWSR
jgi:probable HAF family extracellular repeat protein